MPSPRLLLCTAVLAVYAERTSAQELTLADILQHVRVSSPAAIAARARVAEARARLDRLPLVSANPSVSAAIGRRGGQTSDSDLEVSVAQPLELGGRGGARRAIAQAELDREQALAAGEVREAMRQAASAYHDAVTATAAAALAATAESEARQLLEAARRRYEAGDVAVLDVNVAAASHARAVAERKSAEAASAAALGTVRALGGISPDVSIDVSRESTLTREFDRATVRARFLARPELLALESRVRDAEAQLRLGRALRWPEITPEVRYEREEGTPILWGGLSVSLPVFSRGSVERAVGEARLLGARAELEAVRRAALSEADALLTAHARRTEAYDALRAVADELAENDRLARRSYEEGEIGLAALLLVRRETAETRRATLDRRREAALAALEIEMRIAEWR